jgi:hypothetical protein
MRVSRTFRGAVLSIPVLLSPVMTSAENIDGKKPAICAAVSARSCPDDGDCVSGQPSEFNAPRFLRVDFTGSTIRSERPDGGLRSTPIEGLRTIEDRIVLNGVERGVEGVVGWNLVIGQNDGDMTLAVAGMGISLIVFGACTSLDMQPVTAGSSTR